MNEKRHFFGSIFITLFLLMGYAAVVIYVDPFYHYHKPLSHLSYRPSINLHSYTNPGVARNFDYDTVILGSSMTRTFSTSYVKEKKGWNVAKLSIPEARGKDIKDMYGQIHNETKRIIISLDVFTFQVPPEEEANEKPEYLWNDYLLDDVSYIWNKKVMFENIGKIYDDTLCEHPSYTMDEYQNWEEVLEIQSGEVLEWALNYEAKEQFLEGTYDEKMIQRNIDENLIPMIKEHPQQEFIIYFPAYSIFYWMRSVETNQLNNEFNVIRTMIESILPYDNVAIYFPMDHIDLITAHQHYLDYLHYDSEIAKWIVDLFDCEEEVITKDNYVQRLNAFKAYLEKFPYKKFAEEQLSAL